MQAGADYSSTPPCRTWRCCGKAEVLTGLPSLSSSSWQTLPETFAALTALTRVSLQKNKLTGIPQCVQKWVQLKDLVIADNEVAGLPVPLFEALKELDVPYMCSLPLVFQTTEEWLDSQLGVHPVQVALQVALPELDGAIEPIVFAGRDSNTGKSHSLPDRIDSLCARAIKWASLTKKKNAEKKLAITVFSFPPDKGNVGTAAYLNVFGSIFMVLTDLKKDGYNVGDLPASEKELIMSILNDEEQRFNSNDLNVAYKMTVEEYQRLCPYAEALEENWGAPPGQLNTNGQELLVYGRQFGNVFIGVQPTFGYEGDPMRLLFSKSASPHHGFAAYYTFLESIFEADAVLPRQNPASLDRDPDYLLSGLQYLLHNSGFTSIKDDQGVQIPIPGVEHVHHDQAPLLNHLIYPGQNLSQTRSRDDRVIQVIVRLDHGNGAECTLATLPYPCPCVLGLSHPNSPCTVGTPDGLNPNNGRSNPGRQPVQLHDQHRCGVHRIASLDERFNGLNDPLVHDLEGGGNDAVSDHRTNCVGRALNALKVQ